MDETLKFTPISRTQERAISGRTVAVRCYSPGNPHFFRDELGVFRPIEIERLETAASAKAGAIALRSKNVVSAGLRQDGSLEKYLGLRPDECQALNSESLEFSLVSVILDGEPQSLALEPPRALNAVTQDLGSIIVQNTRQRTRQMVPVRGPIRDFRIEFQLHLKGLTPVYRSDLDEFWLYNDRGEFRFRLVRPEVIDPQTGDPLGAHDEDRGLLQNQVRHSLTSNPDGTWSYVKTPGRDFSPDLWPEIVWLDSQTVYSSTSDGILYYSDSTNSWATLLAATSAPSINTSQTSGPMFYTRLVDATPTYHIYRGFFYFDVSGLSGTVYAARIGFLGISVGSGASTPDFQLGTQADPLTLNDFGSFTGSTYGNITPWSTSAWNWKELPAQGISDLQAVLGSGAFKVVLREHGCDYLGATPTTTKRGGGYFADQADFTSDPYLEIFFVAAGAGVWSSGGNLATARKQLGGAGTQTAGLSFGGNTGSASAITEEYDGSAWASGGNLNTARQELAGCGSQSAGLSFGGYIGSMSAITEEYDGSAWASGGNLILARHILAGAGTQSAGLNFGGGVYRYVTEEYDGAAWASGGNLATARNTLAGAGTQTEGLSFGGYHTEGICAHTEEYDGATWAGGGNLNTARYSLAGCGSQSEGLSFGGITTTYSAVTEEYSESAAGIIFPIFSETGIHSKILR